MLVSAAERRLNSGLLGPVQVTDDVPALRAGSGPGTLDRPNSELVRSERFDVWPDADDEHDVESINDGLKRVSYGS